MTEELWVYGLDKRPTEWQAVFCILYGWMPIAPLGSLDRVMFMAPYHYPKGQSSQRAIHDDVTLGKTPRELAKECPECQKEYPATPEFWYSNGQYGLYSLCRGCKKGMERARYRRNRA